MRGLRALSYALLIILPVLSLVIALYVNSLGFFVYSIPAAVTPGIVGLIVHHYPKKRPAPPLVQKSDEMHLKAE